MLADVRTMPRSRANPQYNEDALPQALQPFGIAYAHMTDLGGLRGRQKSVAPEINGFWENESFHNYADYAMSERFRSASARTRTDATLRHHVCRDGVVALSPPDHHRLFPRSGRDRVPHSWSRASRGGGGQRGRAGEGCRTRWSIRRSRHRSAICSGNSDGSTGNTGEDGPLARRSGAVSRELSIRPTWVLCHEA